MKDFITFSPSSMSEHSGSCPKSSMAMYCCICWLFNFAELSVSKGTQHESSVFLIHLLKFGSNSHNYLLTMTFASINS